MKRKKNEEYKESQITTIHISGFKLYFARKHNLKKSCLYRQVLFTVFMCCGIFETHNDKIHSNDKYANYNVIEIYINRLSSTTQIFIAMDYLIMMSEKYLFLETKNIWQGHFLPNPEK